MPLLHPSFQPVPVIMSKADGFDEVQRKSLWNLLWRHSFTLHYKSLQLNVLIHFFFMLWSQSWLCWSRVTGCSFFIIAQKLSHKKIMNSLRMTAAWNFTLKIWKTKSLECLKTRALRDGFGPNGEGKKGPNIWRISIWARKKEPTQKKEKNIFKLDKEVWIWIKSMHNNTFYCR